MSGQWTFTESPRSLAGNPPRCPNWMSMDTRSDSPVQTYEEVLKQNTKLEQQVASLKLQLLWYEERYRQAQLKRFASSSEQTPVDQLALFNEAEAEANLNAPEPELETVVIQRRKRAKGERDLKLEGLPVETIHFTLEGEDCVCPVCAKALHEMSTEVRREVQVTPPQLKVVEKVRHVYGCRHCEQTDVRTPIVTAPMPAPALPGSFASASLLAQVIHQKYVNSLPLYRQEAQYRQWGIELSRQTMANWLIAVSERWLAPMVKLFHAKLVEQDHAHADETTLQVLKEPGRAAQAKSYLWLYRTGRGAAVDVVLYDYQTGRGGEYPERFLAGFSGYLQTDGLSSYTKVKGVTLLGCCWAHARRNEKLDVMAS